MNLCPINEDGADAEIDYKANDFNSTGAAAMTSNKTVIAIVIGLILILFIVFAIFGIRRRNRGGHNDDEWIGGYRRPDTMSEADLRHLILNDARPNDGYSFINRNLITPEQRRAGEQTAIDRGRGSENGRGNGSNGNDVESE